MADQNLYQVLEIPDYSDIFEVKRAFRKMALRYHPDRNSDPKAIEIFKVLVKTYEILSNTQLKQSYDYRLRTGLNYEVQNPADIRQEKIRWYAKMKKEQDALEEIEKINAYERSLLLISLQWRYILLGLFLMTGMVSILNDWYETGKNIVLGGIISTVALLLTWNEIYKYNWHKSLTNTDKQKDEPGYDVKSYRLILKIFIIGLILTKGLIKIKKVWHLHYFGKVIDARLEVENSRIIYSYNNKFYTSDAYMVPKEYISKTSVLIRISSVEPEIWEFETGK